jgi:hypothetical protein
MSLRWSNMECRDEFHMFFLFSSVVSQHHLWWHQHPCHVQSQPRTGGVCRVSRDLNEMRSVASQWVCYNLSVSHNYKILYIWYIYMHMYVYIYKYQCIYISTNVCIDVNIYIYIHMITYVCVRDHRTPKHQSDTWWHTQIPTKSIQIIPIDQNQPQILSMISFFIGWWDIWEVVWFGLWVHPLTQTPKMLGNAFYGWYNVF